MTTPTISHLIHPLFWLINSGWSWWKVVDLGKTPPLGYILHILGQRNGRYWYKRCNSISGQNWGSHGHIHFMAETERSFNYLASKIQTFSA